MGGVYDKFCQMDIDHLSRLANLALTQEEKKQLEPQLAAALNYFSQIKDASTKDFELSSLEPMVTPTPMVNVLRVDQIEVGEGQNEALKNAPEAVGHLFKVPPVL
jgi:aspartyl-tRNA(Asn)/glutamyl-tRNA(Gln) amidotransferase subunit C